MKSNQEAKIRLAHHAKEFAPGETLKAPRTRKPAPSARRKKEAAPRFERERKASKTRFNTIYGVI
jgi:hypothetical protein